MGTITTMLWKTDGVGDGVATGYTDLQTQRLWRALHLSDPTIMGVVRGEQNELIPTVPGASQINVGTGAAISYGLAFFHDTSITAVALPGVAADTAGLIWAQVDWTTQVGLLGVTQQGSGNTTVPTPTQVAGTTWQIPICSYIIDAVGIVYTDTTKGTQGVTDLRRFIGNKAAGGLYKIGEYIGDGTTGVATFDGIQADFDHLIVEGYGRSDGAGTINSVVLTLNGDAGANYAASRITGQNGAVAHGTTIAGTNILVGDIVAAAGIAGQADGFTIRVPNYTDANFSKAVNAASGSRANGTAAGTGMITYDVAGWWHNAIAQAVTRIDVTLSPGGNWVTGSKISLYGMR